MPWDNKGNGGGPWGQGPGGRGPWGQGPQGGGQQPPNLEDLLRKGQERFRGAFGGGGGGGAGATGGSNLPRWLIWVALLAIALIWVSTGIYTVSPQQQGVVLRFGKFLEQTAPGIHWHLPYPIETVLKPNVTQFRRIEVGFRSVGEFGRSNQRDFTEESLMLTGDENIVDIDFTVQWRINDARAYLFNIQNPENTVKAVAESVMREVVGRSKIDDVLTEGRELVERDTQQIMQETLNSYQAGIEVTLVKLQQADPPNQVIDAFRDVQAARADQERMRNEAQAYANDIVPRARGESEKIRLEAEAYKEQTVADAQGQVSRFLAIFEQYQKAPEVTRKRMYYETLEDVLGGMNKVIVDSKGGGSGVVPYLPLPELQKRAAGNAEARQGANQ